MKISILGSGEVGQALGRGFVATGHDVMAGTRDPANGKLDVWKAQAGSRASVGTFEDAARFGEIVALATLWTGTKSALDLAGPRNLAGKVVIDVTNPLLFPNDGMPTLAVGHTDSGGEQVQRWLPNSRVVKAFNSTGNANFFKPDFPGGPPTMFIAGNDDGAKKAVTDIVTSFGWETVDCGNIEGARLLEPLCILWVDYAIKNRSRTHAFKLLRK
jgi:predicted dinucleotide-binding enzyme